MKSKKEINEYAPWELENKVSDRATRRSIPVSTRKSRIKSKIKTTDQDFLELYTLSREKDRFEKYGSTLGRRVKSIASMWKEVKAKMYNLQNKSANIGTEGIENLIEDEKAKIKENARENMEKLDWEY